MFIFTFPPSRLAALAGWGRDGTERDKGGVGGDSFLASAELGVPTSLSLLFILHVQQLSPPPPLPSVLYTKTARAHSEWFTPRLHCRGLTSGREKQPTPSLGSRQPRVPPSLLRQQSRAVVP